MGLHLVALLFESFTAGDIYILQKQNLNVFCSKWFELPCFGKDAGNAIGSRPSSSIIWRGRMKRERG